MHQTLTWSIIFCASLFALIKSSGYFTKAAEKIGLFLGMSPFIIGVVIVGIGTSLPELVSSIVAVFKDSSEIVVSNVLGSNITNIFLILGITAVIAKKLKFTHNLINIDISFLIGSTFLLVLLIWDQKFSTGDAVISLLGFLIYIFYAVTYQKEALKLKEIHTIHPKLRREKFSINTVFTLLISAGFIFLGANYTIESIIRLSSIFNIVFLCYSEKRDYQMGGVDSFAFLRLFFRKNLQYNLIYE